MKKKHYGHPGDFFMCVDKELGERKKVSEDEFKRAIGWCERTYG